MEPEPADVLEGLPGRVVLEDAGPADHLGFLLMDDPDRLVIPGTGADDCQGVGVLGLAGGESGGWGRRRVSGTGREALSAT